MHRKRWQTIAMVSLGSRPILAQTSLKYAQLATRHCSSVRPYSP
jgi:hypothetical protein